VSDVTNDTFRTTVERLSRQSVDKHFDAYADVDWDGPDMAVRPDDPRFALWGFDPVGHSDWYAALPAGERSRLGLHRVATAMRLGWEFENVLQRGLLEHAFWMPNGRPEFRYLHHEIVEESQHTMMFQEFVNRSGMDVRGMPWHMKAISRAVIWTSRLFPELFFLFVLGGEDPVDYLQRRQLRAGQSHPLVERIMRIHVTEEARHLSFARQYLKAHVPELGPVRRRILAHVAPLLFGIMGRVMVYPSRQTRRTFHMPRRVFRSAFRSPAGRALLCESVSKPRRLCAELGLTTRPARLLWRLMGVWDEVADREGTPARRIGSVGSEEAA
jgi:hypothetical protein